MSRTGWRGLTPALLVATIAATEGHTPATPAAEAPNAAVALVPAVQPDAAAGPAGLHTVCGAWGRHQNRYQRADGDPRPGSCVGIHISLCSSGAPRGVSDPNEGVPPAGLERMRARQAAYADDLTHIQANRAKAQTIGYGLNDSPVGVAGWFMEKYRRYCDCDGHPENGFTKDELLTFISMYCDSRGDWG